MTRIIMIFSAATAQECTSIPNKICKEWTKWPHKNVIKNKQVIK